MKVFVEPYLNFDGNTKEAFRFYQKVFRTPDPYFMTFSEAAQEDGMDDPEWQAFPSDATMHASMKVGDYSIMGSDSMPGEYEPMAGFLLSFAADDVDEVKRVWDEFIAAGSEVQMELEKTFWSQLYGMLKDPYGVPWMIMHYDQDEA